MMDYYSQIFGLSVPLIISYIILKLTAIKTRKIIVLGHLLRHSLLFAPEGKLFLRLSLTLQN